MTIRQPSPPDPPKAFPQLYAIFISRTHFPLPLFPFTFPPFSIPLLSFPSISCPSFSIPPLSPCPPPSEPRRPPLAPAPPYPLPPSLLSFSASLSLSRFLKSRRTACNFRAAADSFFFFLKSRRTPRPFVSVSRLDPLFLKSGRTACNFRDA